MSEPYYAVANGRLPGIYRNWNDTKKQVFGYDGARYKKFDTLEEAEKFIDNYQNGNNSYRKNKKSVVTEVNYDTEPDNMLLVFTDGSAINNGKKNAKAGYAVYWPFHHEFDFGARVPDSQNQSNNCAELLAILKALEQAEALDPGRTKIVRIFTDSEFTINVATKWICGWQQNGWRKADGAEPANLELIKIFYEYLKVRRVEFIHVPAHTGGTDWLSSNNNIVDQMAKAASVLN